MKTIIGYLLGGIIFATGVVWAIFEVIFYFGEKDPINWTSVTLIAIGFVVVALAIVLGFAEQQKSFNKFKRTNVWK